MDKRTARLESEAGWSVGELRDLVALARADVPPARVSRVNPQIPLRMALDLYEAALIKRTAAEILPGDRTPTRDRLIVRNILRDCLPQEGIAALVEPGDVVYRDGDGEVMGGLGVVIEKTSRTVTIVWEQGGRSGGGHLAFRGELRLLHPRVRVEITPGMLGYRGWNREHAVTAVLRRAGLRRYSHFVGLRARHL